MTTVLTHQISSGCPWCQKLKKELNDADHQADCLEKGITHKFLECDKGDVCDAQAVPTTTNEAGCTLAGFNNADRYLTFAFEKDCVNK